MVLVSPGICCSCWFPLLGLFGTSVLRQVLRSLAYLDPWRITENPILELPVHLFWDKYNEILLILVPGSPPFRDSPVSNKKTQILNDCAWRWASCSPKRVRPTGILREYYVKTQRNDSQKLLGWETRHLFVHKYIDIIGNIDFHKFEYKTINT